MSWENQNDVMELFILNFTESFFSVRFNYIHHANVFYADGGETQSLCIFSMNVEKTELFSDERP